MGSEKAKNNYVSSENILDLDCKLSGRLFMYIRKGDGPKLEPCRIPTSADDQLKHWPLLS